jgi:hypothetical protein
MAAEALWGVGSADSAELRGHVRYLAQQELRTTAANREAWSGPRVRRDIYCRYRAAMSHEPER